jgi:hypothetical protein
MKYLKLFENWLLEAETDASKILEELKKTTIGEFKKASDKGEFLKNIFAKAMQKDPSKFDPNAGSSLKVEVIDNGNFYFRFKSEFFSSRPNDIETSWGTKYERTADDMERDQSILKNNKISAYEIYGADFSKFIGNTDQSDKKMKIEDAEKLLAVIKKNSDNFETDFLKKIKGENDRDKIWKTMLQDEKKLEAMLKFYKGNYPDGKVTKITIDPAGDEEKEMVINITKSIKSSDNSDDKSILDFECDGYNVLNFVEKQDSYANQQNAKPTLGMFMTFLQSYAKGSPSESLLFASAKKKYNDTLAGIFASSKVPPTTAVVKGKK